MAESELISSPGETRQPNIIVCAAITWAVGGIFVGLRVYSRRVLVHAFGLEDWFIIFALLSGAGFTASVILRT
jgi:hypothetical protein